MDIEEYKKQLARHDWFYDYSDDYRVWNNGRANRDRLTKIAQDGTDEFKVAFNEEWMKHFHTQTFDFPPAPFEIGE